MHRLGIGILVAAGLASLPACNAIRVADHLDSGLQLTPDSGPVLTGDGGYQLVLGTPTSLPNPPTLLAVADLNGDGKLDALVLYGQKGGHQAQVFLGVGDGTFIAGSLLETVQLPQSVVIADFDGDGNLDAAIGACRSAGSDSALLMFPGDGTGNFGSAVSTPLSVCPFSLAVADFNGDGISDLATAGPGPTATTPTTGEVDVYAGGKVGLSPLKSLPFASQALGLTAADFNGDGHPDLAISLSNNELLRLYGDGQGNFAGFAPLTLAETAYRLVHAADLNGDGHPDLLLTDIRGWMALFDSTDQNGSTTLSAPNYFLAGNQLTAVAFADLGGRGQLAIASANASANYTGVTLMAPQGDGSYAYQEIFTHGPAYGIAAGDSNGDGRVDLIYTDNSNQALGVLLNQPLPDASDAGAFIQAAHNSVPPVPNHGGPVITSPQMITLTYDDDAQREQDEPYAAWIVQSDWLVQALGEYGVTKGTNLNVHLAGPAPTTITDAQIQTLIATLILDGGVPPPVSYDGGETDQLYTIYFPLQTTITGDVGTSCQSYGGYHTEGGAGAKRFVYAVIPTCGYTGNLSSTESAVSHELAEAVTDPFPGTNPTYTWSGNRISNGWYGELADLCQWFDVSEDHNYVAQRIWSNKAALAGTQPCVPNDPGLPYAMAAPSPSSLIQLAAGQSVQITLQGWSDQPTEPFAISAANYDPSPIPANFNPTFAFDTDTLSNGETATLTITVPAGTPRQSIGMVVIYAGLSDSNFGYWPLVVAVP